MINDDLNVLTIINVIKEQITNTISIREASELYDFLIKKGIVSEINKKLINTIIEKKRKETKRNELEEEFDLLESFEKNKK